MNGDGSSEVTQVMAMTMGMGEKAMEYALKFLGGTSALLLQVGLWVYHSKFEQIGGSVSMRNLIQKKGPEIEMARFPSEDPQKIKEMCEEMKKRGIMVTIMPDVCIGDGQTEFAFHESDASKVQAYFESHQDMIMQPVEAEKVELKNPIETGRHNIISLEDYANHATKEGMEMLKENAVHECKTEYGKKKILVPEESKTVEKEKLTEFQKKLQGPGKKITINNEKLFKSMDEKFFISRIPYKKDEYLVVPMSDYIKKIDNGKTSLVSLKPEKEYAIVNQAGEAIETRSGATIYAHYDEVKRNFEKKMRDALKKRQTKIRSKKIDFPQNKK